MRISEIEQEGNPKDLVEFIMNNCKPWLSQTNNGQYTVYRGADIYSTKWDTQYQTPVAEYPIELVFMLSIKTDRRPKGNIYYREVYDKVLSALGTTATRSNSASVTADIDEADQHGTPYVFLPVGDFHYVWSDQIIDWGSFTIADPDEFTDFFADLRKQNPSTTLEEAMEKYITPTIKFDDGSLLDAIDSEHEIAIHASHGLYIDPMVYREILRV